MISINNLYKYVPLSNTFNSINIRGTNVNSRQPLMLLSSAIAADRPWQIRSGIVVDADHQKWLCYIDAVFFKFEKDGNIYRSSIGQVVIFILVANRLSVWKPMTVFHDQLSAKTKQYKLL